MTVDELTADLAKEHEEWLSHKPQTVYDLVKQIYELLLKMKQDGRTDSEICYMLIKRGIDISAGTFATYMKRVSKELRGGTRPRMARKRNLIPCPHLLHHRLCQDSYRVSRQRWTLSLIL